MEEMRKKTNKSFTLDHIKDQMRHKRLTTQNISESHISSLVVNSDFNIECLKDFIIIDQNTKNSIIITLNKQDCDSTVVIKNDSEFDVYIRSNELIDNVFQMIIEPSESYCLMYCINLNKWIIY
jgi:putative ribosome biogenesis GTPase RsgA